ncbi:MAG: LacI family DNA-binding transcriptional regulator [Pseudomonadota bacterium]
MSIKKVANIAGVSIATVSRFFNNPNQVSKQTREKVEAAIKRINYTPNALAQNLRRGKTGLVIAVSPHITSPLYEDIIQQLNQSAKNNSYNLLVKEAGFNSLPLSYYEQMIRCKQADGFVLLVGLPEHEQDIDMDVSLPIVLACEPHQLSAGRPSLPCITIDHKQATQEATDYLIHLGHQAIAFIASDHDPLTVREQQSGFQKSMLESKLSLFGRLLSNQQDNLSIERKLHRLLDTQSRPTAIICADDETAMETLHHIKSLGLKVPGDISLIGFSNIRYAEMTDPPLTTIDCPMDIIGNIAMQHLLELIDGKSVTRHLPTLEHSLIIRNSTRRI